MTSPISYWHTTAVNLHAYALLSQFNIEPIHECLYDVGVDLVDLVI